MNENDIRKPNENQTSNSLNNTRVFDDMEIFDFDAHRKSKIEAEQPKKALTSSVSPSSNNVSKTVPTRTSSQTPPRQPRTPNMQGAVNKQPVSNVVRTPNTPRTAPKPTAQQPKNVAPVVTDIKPDKVVFDSSIRKPLTKKTASKKITVQKPIKPYEEKTRGANPIAVLSKALIYVAVVLLVSALASYFIITVANDVFAFVKADAQVEVVIPEYATLDQIADELHGKQIIKYPKMFVLYTIIRGRDDANYKAGVYTVSPQQNFDQLYYTFVERKTTTMTEISVTIPEGYTIDDMIKLFVEEHGMGTKEGFIDAIQNGVYDYWFLKELKVVNPNRKYRLEGYLYPDTYYFYKEWPEEKIIDKMLSNFYSKFDIKYKQECDKAGMSIDDVVNLASIIQMEARAASDFTAVSSVFHNRLNSNYYNKKLESCATVQYILPERKERLSNADTQIDNPYNTYQNGGLPPGPISNPTLKAIRAALYPDQTQYYYFQNDINGDLLFAKTLAEHNANRAIVDKQYADAGRN